MSLLYEVVQHAHYLGLINNEVNGRTVEVGEVSVV